MASSSGYVSARSQLGLVAGGLVGSAAVGAALALAPMQHVLVVLAIGAFPAYLALRQPWGVALPLAPVMLYPTGYPDLQVAILTAALAAAWLALGANRVQVSTTAFAAVVLLGLYMTGAVFKSGRDLQEPIVYFVLWLTGLLLGAGVAATPKALNGLALIAVPTALLAIAQAIGFDFQWSSLTGLTKYDEAALRTGEFRSTSTFGHPLIAGAALAVCAALLVRRKTIPSSVFATICAAGSITTVSRSAMLGLALAGVAILWVERRSAIRTLLALGVVAAAAAAVVTWVPAINESFASRVSNNSEVQTVRSNTLATLATTLEERPQDVVLGGGIGTAREYLAGGRGVDGLLTFDNQYATAVWDLGLLPLIALVTAMWWSLRRAPLMQKDHTIPSLVGFVAILAFVDGLYWPPLGLLFFFVYGMSTAEEREVSSPGDAQGIAVRPTDRRVRS